MSYVLQLQRAVLSPQQRKTRIRCIYLDLAYFISTSSTQPRDQLFPKRHSSQMAKVLVAIDGSKHGNDALLWASRHMYKDGMQFDVVTGVHPHLNSLHVARSLQSRVSFPHIRHPSKLINKLSDLLFHCATHLLDYSPSSSVHERVPSSAGGYSSRCRSRDTSMGSSKTTRRSTRNGSATRSSAGSNSSWGECCTAC